MSIKINGLQDMFMRYIIIIYLLLLSSSAAQNVPAHDDSLDARVRRFLSVHQKDWRDMNISYADGEKLFALIAENGYTRALEIGTSTGHSAVWIAWALSRTGGRLITLEIDEDRHREALQNFREAGLSEFIDARLVDAHEEVPRIEDSLDFVFLDADKSWYKRYFQLLADNLEPGGCITAHNVLNRYMSGIESYLNYIRELPGFRTEIFRTSSSGISASYKIKGTK